jgi:hypothetical protein
MKESYLKFGLQCNSLAKYRQIQVNELLQKKINGAA